MIKNINLLPKKEKVRDVKGIILNVIMAIFSVILICLVVAVLFLLDLDRSLSERLAEFERINMRAQNYSNSLKIYKDFESKVNKKKTIVQDLNSDKIFWSATLYDIGKFIPDNVYIKYFEGRGSELYGYMAEYAKGQVQEEGNINYFIIHGDAKSYADILKFVIELKKVVNVRDIWLESISKSVIPGTNLEVSGFVITAYWDTEPFLEGIKITGVSGEGQEIEDLLEEDLQ